VLLLDSDQKHLERIAFALRAGGLRVIALDHLQVGPPIYNVLQPDAAVICSPPNGRWQVEAARKLRQLSRGSLPIFAVLDPPADHQRCHWLEKLRALDAFLKPVDTQELIAKLLSSVRIHRAVQRLSREANEARSSALEDPTTAAGSRAFLFALIDAEIRRAERYGGTFAVGVCAVDGFEQYHQAFGRSWKAPALRHAARLLERAIRACDDVCRLADSQFGLFLPGTDGSGLAVLRERLIAGFQRAPLQFEDRWVKLPFSVGLASFPETVGPAKNLLRAALEDLRRSRTERWLPAAQTPTLSLGATEH
jgi:two-component system cell cycle response regulator